MDITEVNQAERGVNATEFQPPRVRPPSNTTLNRSAAEYAKKMRRRKAHRAKIKRSHANG